MNYILLYKPLGLSPQQAIEAYRYLHPEYQSLKLGSVGRLDPMAEGLLIVMVGDENKNQSQYIGLDKDYEVELVLGISTDSYDLLGMPTTPINKIEAIDEATLEPILASYSGQIRQPYPPYSAVRVDSKPLYWWAREGRLDEIIIPIAERYIYDLSLLRIEQITLSDFKQDLVRRIRLVTGDFRQAEILAAWDKLLDEDIGFVWNIKLRVSCSSGTFVRGLVHQIGLDLGYGAVTRSIVRTKVGDWELKNAEYLSNNNKRESK